jgi:2-hydroxychromene-2-carboxylate isomerase
MSMEKNIHLIHDAGSPPAGLAELAAEARAQGAGVVVRPCAEPYDAVLDAIEKADTVVFWS